MERKKPTKKVAPRSSPAKAGKAAPKSAPIKSANKAKPDGRPGVEVWLTTVRPELQPIASLLDGLILEAMPDAVCTIKWNVPFYGLRGQGWIVALNSFKAHVKLIFFDGSSLDPMLPAGKDNTYIDYRTVDEIDVKQVKMWLKQAKKLPGWLKVE